MQAQRHDTNSDPHLFKDPIKPIYVNNNGVNYLEEDQKKMLTRHQYVAFMDIGASYGLLEISGTSQMQYTQFNLNGKQID